MITKRDRKTGENWGKKQQIISTMLIGFARQYNSEEIDENKLPIDIKALGYIHAVLKDEINRAMYKKLYEEHKR